MKKVLIFSLLGNLLSVSFSMSPLSKHDWILHCATILNLLENEPYPEVINAVDDYLARSEKLGPKEKEEIIKDVLIEIDFRIQATDGAQKQIWINKAIFINLILGPEAMEKIMENFNEKISPLRLSRVFTPAQGLAIIEAKFREIAESEELSRIKAPLRELARAFFERWLKGCGENIREAYSWGIASKRPRI